MSQQCKVFHSVQALKVLEPCIAASLRRTVSSNTSKVILKFPDRRGGLLVAIVPVNVKTRNRLTAQMLKQEDAEEPGCLGRICSGTGPS